MRNEGGFAGQALSKRGGAAWPPSEWDEDDFHRDAETRLPTTLHPFHMFRERDSDERLTGHWAVDFHPWAQQAKPKRVGVRPDIFSAFILMVEAYRDWFPSRPLPQVYFIGEELKVGKMLKVGFSANPELRLRQLQTACPERLQIFATMPGTKADEEKYHRRWRARRRSGEWFVIGDCIIAEIERIKAALSP